MSIYSSPVSPKGAREEPECKALPPLAPLDLPMQEVAYKMKGKCVIDKWLIQSMRINCFKLKEKLPAMFTTVVTGFHDRKCGFSPRTQSYTRKTIKFHMSGWYLMAAFPSTLGMTVWGFNGVLGWLHVAVWLHVVEQILYMCYKFPFILVSP